MVGLEGVYCSEIEEANSVTPGQEIKLNKMCVFASSGYISEQNTRFIYKDRTYYKKFQNSKYLHIFYGCRI